METVNLCQLMSIFWIVVDQLLMNILSLLFIEKTPEKNSVHAKSAHTTSLKQGLPYSQFLRFHRICS